jgi:hypothetical protein
MNAENPVQIDLFGVSASIRRISRRHHEANDYVP